MLCTMPEYRHCLKRASAVNLWADVWGINCEEFNPFQIYTFSTQMVSEIELQYVWLDKQGN